MADPLTPDSAVRLLLPALAAGPAMATDPDSGQAGGRMLAALNLGHFGIKPQASDDNGRHWHKLPTPAYPPQPPEATGPAWQLGLIWRLEAAYGTLWASTLPGGLLVGMGCGGVWSTVDDGGNRALRSQGLQADDCRRGKPTTAPRQPRIASSAVRSPPACCGVRITAASGHRGNWPQRHLALNRWWLAVAAAGCASAHRRCPPPPPARSTSMTTRQQARPAAPAVRR